MIAIRFTAGQSTGPPACGDIAKLVRDQADYYLEAVAGSQEEYYTGAGEAPGYWLGRAAGELGLGGTVTEDGLHRILNGAHPLTGGAPGCGWPATS